MKIQQKVGTHKITFSFLTGGDTFRAVESNPDVIWMKTCRIQSYAGDFYNAVDLSDGDMDMFRNDEEVVPVTITAVEE